MKISNKVKTVVAGVVAVAAMAATTLVATPAVSAVSAKCPDGTPLGAGKTLADCDKIKNKDNDLLGTVQIIIDVIIGVIGLVAVVMVIIGGVSYTTSAGDPGKVKKAKDTILYGVVGLVIAILAFAIVNFVIGSITKTN